MLIENGNSRGDDVLCPPVFDRFIGLRNRGNCNKCRSYQKSLLQDVGDGEGHQTGVVKGAGTSLLPDGTYAHNTFVSTIDYVNGNGPFTVYLDLVLNDGAALWYKDLGQATVKGKETELKVAVTIMGGKGRFAGAKGDGTLTGTACLVPS